MNRPRGEVLPKRGNQAAATASIIKVDDRDHHRHHRRHHRGPLVRFSLGFGYPYYAYPYGYPAYPSAGLGI